LLRVEPLPIPFQLELLQQRHQKVLLLLTAELDLLEVQLEQKAAQVLKIITICSHT
jgi:hypothetical protein